MLLKKTKRLIFSPATGVGIRTPRESNPSLGNFLIASTGRTHWVLLPLPFASLQMQFVASMQTLS